MPSNPATATKMSLWDLGGFGTTATLVMGGILLFVIVGEIGALASKLHGGRAEATITSFRTQSSKGGAPSYFPVFRFKTVDGREVEVASGIGSGWKFVSVGERVSVAYPATRPEDAEMLGWSMYMKLILWTVLALPFLLIGVISLIRASRRRFSARS